MPNAQPPVANIQPLRFVLLVNGPTLYRWQAAALQSLLDGGNARLELVVTNGKTKEAFAPKLSGINRIVRNPQLLWNLLNRVAVNNRCAAIQPVPWAEMVSAPQIEATPYRIGKFSEGIDEPTLQAIARVNPDFILRFGFGILKGGIQTAAKHGIWSFHHGNPSEFRGLPPAFWEISNRATTTGVILQKLGDKLDDGQVLHQGWFQTKPQSFNQTLETIYMGSAHFAARVCAEVLATGELPEVPKDTPGPVYRAPKNMDIVRFVWRLAANRVANIIRYRLKRQQWNVAIVPAPIQTVAGLNGPQAQAAALAKAHWMPEKRGRFYADPFGLAPRSGDDSEATIVFEDFDWAADKGRIAWTRYSDASGFSEPQPLIEDATHYSYPFTFSDGGKELCIPENFATRRCDQHEVANGEAARAVARSAFSDLPLIDPTIIRHQGRLWMFAAIDGTTPNTELHIFHADDLSGPWQPHPLNPVKTDVRSARPGGNIFEYGGALYRPAQDCSVNYGGRLSLNRIDRLDARSFSETIVGTIDPLADSPNPGGLHTLTSVGDCTLIDGCRYPWFFRW